MKALLFWQILIGFIITYFFLKIVFFYIKKIHLVRKHKQLRFLLVKIPKKDSEKDKSNDMIQNMKQNIEIMNQVLKNFLSIKSGKISDWLLGNNYMSLEIFVEKGSIKFIVGVAKEFLDMADKTISSFYPGSVVDEIAQPKLLDAGKYVDGGEFVLKKNNAFPIKMYESFEADPMESVLSAYSRLTDDEKLLLQVLVAPIDGGIQKKIKKVSKKIKEGKHGFSLKAVFKKLFDYSDSSDKKGENKEDDSKYSSQQTQDLEKKVEEELFLVKIRTLAVSIQPSRLDKISKDLVSAFAQYNYIGLNSIVFKKHGNLDRFVKDTIDRIYMNTRFNLRNCLFVNKNMVLNMKELSSIYHFPHSRFNKSPRIKWQKFRIVPGPDNLPDEGISIGFNDYGGVSREVKIGLKDRFRHFYVLGQTGTGKTSMLLLKAKQDLREGRGFCYIDPHGDIAEQLIQYFPKERIDDLIYFNASDMEMPVGFNVLEADTEEERDIVTNDLVGTFIQMYGPEIFGPRIQDYFRHSVLALMEQPEGGTLTELVRLFVDDAFQKMKLRNVKNPVVRNWFEKTFKAMGDREKAEIIPYYQAKFGSFTTGGILRNIIGQPKSSFNIYEAMQSNKVLIMNLSKGLMGEENSNLLGSLMVVQLKLGALRRAKIPEAERNPYYLYIDEFQNFINPSIETILSEARKYKLGLIIAHQYIDQLAKRSLGGDTDLKPAIFGNVGSKFIYQVGADDAEFLEKEFSPEFSKEDLQSIDKYNGICRIAIDSEPCRPFTVKVTDPYDEPLNPPDKVKVMKEISRLKWGRKKDLVEKEIFYRAGA